jgi:hypothetical protein
MISGLDKQVLQPIQELEFFPEQHRYKYKGKWLQRSVTEILSFDMSDEARANIEATRSEWEPRGNHLHACLEQYLCGAALLDPTPFGEWWDPLAACWLWKDATVLGTEVRLVDPKKSLAGSTDFLIRTAKGSVVLGDLKTVSSIKSMQRRKPAEAQLGAYMVMLNNLYPNIIVDKCATVVSAPGQTRVLSSEPDHCVEKWLEQWDKWKAHCDVLPF